MSSQNKTIYSVSKLNFELRQILESSFSEIWVEGEISNLATPKSGHSYFSIKDERAQIRCAFFKNKKSFADIEIEDGKKVLLKAKVALYEPRGDCQLIIEKIEPIGDGALQKDFEELKIKLSKEGLFDPEKKKELPKYPNKIGIISSSSGAAIQDILNVLKRRYPSALVTLYATSVQGNYAVNEIKNALKFALTKNDDVLIIARGGGSLEDLSAFNDEGIAREIFQASIPIVSAIGHEIDFTIADFVADKRAPTPSAAAEIVSPDSSAIIKRSQEFLLRLRNLQVNTLKHNKILLNQAVEKLNFNHPHTKIRQQQQLIDEINIHLKNLSRISLEKSNGLLGQYQHRLKLKNPIDKINNLKKEINQINKQISISVKRGMAQKKGLFVSFSRQLNSISPLKTLERGFSVVQRNDGQVIKNIDQVSINERLLLSLAKGSLRVSVLKKNK